MAINVVVSDKIYLSFKSLLLGYMVTYITIYTLSFVWKWKYISSF